MPALYLCAAEPLWAPAGDDRLVPVLADLGLVEAGAAVPGVAGGLRAGPNFTALVIFLGCSPHIVLDPAKAGDGQPVCYLRQHLYDDVRLVAPVRGGVRVRCPHCRRPATGAESGVHDALYTCSGCGRKTAVHALDWRQSAGFGRCFLEIGGIHPHEAVPSDRLLGKLQAYSGTGWRYFYAG